jgi:hypothetical protein
MAVPARSAHNLKRGVAALCGGGESSRPATN